MNNKTCGDCRFLESAKKIGVCDKMNFCLCPSELPACSKFERKVVTNGDRILQGGNRALAQFAYMSLRICRMCTFSQLEEGRYECAAEHGQSCIDGIEAWLNAPAESQLNDAIQNVIKDGVKNAIDIHEAAYAPDMNDGTMADCVKQNENHDTQPDLCKADNTESEGKMSKICGECINFDRSLSKCHKMQDDSIRATDTVLCCPFYELKPPTLFDTITSSPEVLAEKLVYCNVKVREYPVGVELTSGWYSTIIRNKVWSNEEEAIAATVEKLKEVNDAENR